MISEGLPLMGVAAAIAIIATLNWLYIWKPTLTMPCLVARQWAQLGIGISLTHHPTASSSPSSP